MLDLVGINYWSVLVVWILYMAVGAWWYSTAGFAKPWTKYTGIDILKIPQDQATKIIGWVAISALIQALSLAILFNSLAVESILHGVTIGLLVWFGFTAATTVGVTFYGKRGWRFLWLNSSYFLIVMIIASIIFSVWK